MRYMCLACGHFFYSDSTPLSCEYCKDAFLTDNIFPDIPPPISNLQEWQDMRLKEIGL